MNDNELTNLPTAPLVRPRKLHRGHFAFMRAETQGLDTRDSWERYLRIEGEHSDARNVKRAIAWMRDEFAVAARRSDRYGTARLVRYDPKEFSDAGADSTPTMEAFAIERGMEDFSHAEQLEAYQEQYGTPTARLSRRARIIKKQLAALKWLEDLVAQPPLAGDAVASWLHPDLAVRIEGAGIYTVRALIDHINGTGARWWTGIAAIGTTKATRILDWLRAHQATIAIPIGTHVAVPRAKLYAHELVRIVPRSTAIVPFDKFIVPAELDGTQGRFRAPQLQCLLRATNDYDAILAWVKSRRGLTDLQKADIKRRRGIDPTRPEAPLDWLDYLSHTQRSYLKEAERLLLWSILVHRKPLSSLTVEDSEAYRAFLANPAPSDRWCGKRGRAKWGVSWRPFEGPLSVSGQAHVITILKGFYAYLVDQRYLVGNPWRGVAAPVRQKARAALGRSFTQAQWHFIQRQIDGLPDTSANRRLSLTLHLFYATGVRLSEGVRLTVDDLSHISYPPEGDDTEMIEGWELRVLGKGNIERIVPVPYSVVSELARYLESRGLDIDPEAASNQGAHLLGRAVDVADRAPWSPMARSAIDPKSGVTASTLYAQLKLFFIRCAEAYIAAGGEEKCAANLKRASTHWLRHTHGAHAVAAGTPLDIVQLNLGHKSLDTTTIYVTSESQRRMRAMQKFWDKNN